MRCSSACSNSAGLQQRGLRATYLQREILASSISCIRAVERTRARCAHGVAPTAASHTAHQPQLCVLAHRAFMADATNEGGVVLQLLLDTSTADSIRQERVAFGALCCVVDILWAYLAFLVQPLGCEFDSGLAEFDKLASNVASVAMIASQCSCPSLQAYFKTTICFSHVLPSVEKKSKRG